MSAEEPETKKQKTEENGTSNKSALEALKDLSVIVADTGDIASIERALGGGRCRERCGAVVGGQQILKPQRRQQFLLFSADSCFLGGHCDQLLKCVPWPLSLLSLTSTLA